jgi:hypothetical protein
MRLLDERLMYCCVFSFGPPVITRARLALALAASPRRLVSLHDWLVNGGDAHAGLVEVHEVGVSNGAVAHFDPWLISGLRVVAPALAGFEPARC